MTTTPRRATAVMAAPLLALAVSACGANPNLDIPGKKEETVVVTVTGKGGLDSDVVGGGASAVDEVPNCNRDMDLSETDFAPFGWTEKVLISENGGAKPSDGRAFHFEIIENEFDACRPLSWVTLGGGSGDLAEQAGTGASIAEAVVFFLGDELVTQPMPVEVDKIESVTRNSSDSVTVQYGVGTRSTAEGVTEHYTVEYAAEGGQLVEHSSTFPRERYEQHMKLDFDAGPVPQGVEKVPLGNAHTR